MILIIIGFWLLMLTIRIVGIIFVIIDIDIIDGIDFLAIGWDPV